MAKRRLNQDIREKLFRLARENASPSKEVAAMERAYAKAARLVRAAVDRGFPVEEMAILQKYKAGGIDRCIRLANSDGEITGFEYRRDDESAPHLPRGHCSSRAHSAPQKTIEAVVTHDRAKIAFENAVAAIIEDYRAMIFGSRYAEDVLEIWPASAPILEPFIASGSTAVAALSQEAIQRIRRTNLGADDIAA